MAELGLTNNSGTQEQSEIVFIEEPDEESEDFKEPDNRNGTTPSTQQQVENNEAPPEPIGTKEYITKEFLPENQEGKVNSTEGVHPAPRPLPNDTHPSGSRINAASRPSFLNDGQTSRNRVYPAPGPLPNGTLPSGSRSLPNGVPLSGIGVADSRPRAPKDMKRPQKEIIPCKPTWKAENIFAMLFLILLTISNFAFAVTSRVSTHILIWNLGPLHDIVFATSNDTSFRLNDTSTGLANTAYDSSCNDIRRTVGSLFIAMGVPCLLTILESRYMFYYAWNNRKTINKGTLFSVFLVDVINFLALVSLLTLFLSGFEPYTAATLYFFINPNSISFACCCCKNKNARCCCQSMKSFSVIVTICVVLFIVFSDNSVLFRLLMIILLCFTTISSFIWDHYINVQQQEATDKEKNVQQQKATDQDKRVHPEEATVEVKNLQQQEATDEDEHVHPEEATDEFKNLQQQEAMNEVINIQQQQQQDEVINIQQEATEENKKVYTKEVRNGVKIIKPVKTRDEDKADMFDLSHLKALHYYAISSGILNIAKCLILGGVYLILETVFIDGNDCGNNIPFQVAGANIGASFMCYISSKTACKILRQKVSFFLPLVLSVFVTPFVLFAISHAPFITSKVDFLMPRGSLSEIKLQPESEPLLFGLLLGTFVCGFISFCVSIKHVFQREGRLQGLKSRLFIKPMYCPVFIEQFLLLNRRRHDQPDEDDRSQNDESRHNAPVKLYMCATMWHEKPKEMRQLINSILKMDKEHPNDSHISRGMSSSDNSQLSSNTSSGLKVDLKAHIIFDDAFDEHSCKLNRYVETLSSTLDDCLGDDDSDPISMKTPYGGRLQWTLPCGNELVVHLKDSKKVRRKKRWSQILYMNYIIEYLEKENLKHVFILALDGDVNFKPKAVNLLIERMQKNTNVGAACGRIHPLGSGPMVWFQKFEYALSHWMQKSAEHVLGCVLCSPGCFSLFRAEAVKMTMDKYSKEPEKPEDYVRYDQGEDRWLSSLLLQAGFKIEYCAASDAKTFAPEGFFEFYKQRRRWVPSTMGNILAIIKKKKTLVSNNHYIRTWYIWYQFLLFGTSILTPGTIFLLILGSIMTAFPNIEPIVALLINIIPVSFFVVACFLTSENTQLYIAGLLTNIYTLMMLAVLVGLLNISIEAGLCSVTSVFMIYVASIFFIAALLHPKEFWNIKYGTVYFLSIPSTSMLLMFYAMINLHVITWGTRESYKNATESSGTFSSIGSLCRFPCFKRSERESGTEDGMAVIKKSKDYKIEFDVQKMYQSTTNSSIKAIWEFPEKRVKVYHLILKERDTKRIIRKCTIEDTETEKEFKDLQSNVTYIVYLTAVFYNDEECTVHTSITTGQRDKNYGIEFEELDTDKFDDTSMVVEWKKPKSEVLEYHLQWTNVDTGNLIDKCDVDKNVYHKHVYNLSPSTTYIFELKADFKDNRHNIVRKTFTTKELRKWFENSTNKEEIAGDEKNFLKALKRKYLKIDNSPINIRTEKQNRITGELLSLRNRICVMFFMVNIVFVAIIYILTHISAYQGNLSIALWCQSQDVSSQTKLEPISITFILMFGILLLIQFVSMLLHRISTMIQVLASMKEKGNNNDSDNIKCEKGTPPM